MSIKNNSNSSSQNKTIFYIIIGIGICWLALLGASVITKDMNFFQWLSAFTIALQTPWQICFNYYSLHAVFFSLMLYAFAVFLYDSESQNKRTGEEYGSAKWGKAQTVNKHYQTAKDDRYMIFTQNVRMSMNSSKLKPMYKRNHNVMVVGGSGSGKTRYYVLPNLLQADCSYICSDPKGELLRNAGGVLRSKNFEVKVLNLIDMEQSDGYNPFVYLHSDTDVIRLVTNLIQNTTPKQARSNDPFWEKSETALLSAFILYLWYEAPIEEQNFGMVMYMLENAAASEDDENYLSPVDMLFNQLEQRVPDHIALKQYKVFKQAAGKTAKSILVSTAVRLAVFNLPTFNQLTNHDDMNLSALGERKQVIFAVIPDNDTSFNFLVGMLYSQAFQALYLNADTEHNGSLPIPVRVLMDEFYNVALPDNFEHIIATCRSRSISINIILQNIAQLKSLFKDSWENITGNTDTFLYLGGNEQSTFEYVSKLLGKATISTKTTSQSKGRSGSYSQNRQSVGRELMTPDEVRMLNNEEALLFIRGELPVQDKKYHLEQHPNYKATPFGGGEIYHHRHDEQNILPKGVAMQKGRFVMHDDLSRLYDIDTLEILE